MAYSGKEKNGDPASAADGSANAVEQANPGNSYFRVFRYGSSAEHGMQALATICALASGVGIAMVNLVFGQFITVITDYVTGKSTPDEFRHDSARLALYFFIIGIGRLIVSYGYSTLFTIAAYRVTRNIRYLYLKSALSQEISYFDAGTSGSIAMQATSNGKLIQGGISEKLGMVCQGLSAFVAAFVLAFVTQWKLTLICCCIAPATLIVMGVSSAFEAAIETKILHVTAQGGSFVENILSTARTVQAFDLRERLMNGFDKYLQDARALGDKKNLIFGCMFSAEYFIIFAGIGLCFWQAIGMLARGEVEKPGDVFIVLMSVIIGSTSLTAIAPYLIDFSRAASAAAELFRLIDRASVIDPFNEGGEQPTEVVGNIDLQGVSFSYPMRPGVKVLDDFTLHIPAGKVTALVGASGSGKSTIIGLIERWYNPDAGTISLDGKPIDKLNLGWLRKHIRLVQQEPVLFAGTVFDNIANGLVGTKWQNESREEKLARVTEAAKIAFAHDFISALPNGYDTIIGERGGLLSGGQKQRVAIARSVVSQPKILLLDEATSALDPHAEEVVQEALNNVSKGRTTITIAHKLATIRNADNIVVMGKGLIIEQGTHHDLLRADGAYSRLVRAQDLSVAANALAESESTDNGTEEEDEHMNLEMAKTETHYSLVTNERMKSHSSRDDYDSWKPYGLLHTIWRLVISSPELNWVYLILIITCLLSAASYPGQAILMSRFIEVFEFTGDEMRKKGNFFSLMFLAIACGCLVVYFIMGFTSNIVAQTLNQKYRRQIVHDMLRQDLQFFDRPENTTGALTSRTDSYPYAVFELMGFNVAMILTAVIGVLSCCAVALAYGWRLGLVIIFAGLPPMLLSGYARIRMEAAMDSKISKRFSMSASIASEAVNAIRTVSSLAIEESVLERYTSELDHAISDSTKPIMSIMVVFAFTQSVEYFFQALGFWYGCRLVSFGDLNMVNFFTAFLAVFFSGQQASILFGFSSSMTKATNAANYIFWLEQLNPLITDTDENRNIGPTNMESLDFHNVQFSYPMRPHARVLRGIDLKIKKGQFIAFVGASGCGKSTMISMLERYYDPVKGQIVVDGTPLCDMNPWKYRADVALVQQEPTLYPGSIRQNISMGIPARHSSATKDESIIAACMSANAWDFICSLPDGLDTPCGTNGLQMSGGQRQRIAIARALIRNPKLLLLDEATSALDTQSERIVQEALNAAAATGDRTTIAVAHRLSTVRHADMILVFHGGKIAAAGTHEELIATSEMYRKMCDAQNLDG
ncbi:unnamed protein product [Clonostachys chloroleuca]|uniref:Uncharacterized protein n=1 Tax=Clonostachys chloroleuca TaxID=1926264 RepID=A0AA35PSS8_9HYPO|nr:unnamed protein product [Clonostachys chloroleuca]